MRKFVLATLLFLSFSSIAAQAEATLWSMASLLQISRECMDPIFRNTLERLYGIHLDKQRWQYWPDGLGMKEPTPGEYEGDPSQLYYFNTAISSFGMDAGTPLYNECNAYLVSPGEFSVRGASSANQACPLWRADLGDFLSFRGFAISYLAATPYFYDIEKDALGNIIRYKYGFENPQVIVPDEWESKVVLTSSAGGSTKIVIDLEQQKTCMLKKLQPDSR